MPARGPRTDLQLSGLLHTMETTLIGYRVRAWGFEMGIVEKHGNYYLIGIRV